MKSHRYKPLSKSGAQSDNNENDPSETKKLPEASLHGSSILNWYRRRDSNPGPKDYDSFALPTELHRHRGKR